MLICKKFLPLLVTVMVIGSTPISGALAQELTCPRYELGLEGVWLHSVVSDGDSVLAVDPFNLRVLRLGAGRVEEEITKIDFGSEATPMAPTLLQRLDEDQLLLSNGPDHLITVNSAERGVGTKHGPQAGAFQVQSNGWILKGSNASGEEVSGIFEWTAVGRGAANQRPIIAFADVKVPSESDEEATFRSGFIWFERDGKSFDFVQEIDGDSAEATFYFLLYPYMATIGDRAYFLRMTEHPSIYEYDPHREPGERLRSLGYIKSLAYRPNLPPYDGTTPMTEYYSLLSNSWGPRGLYSWNDKLWVLGRDQGLRWMLYQVDPREPGQTGFVESKVYLPTSAAHLAVAPGEVWTFLEKEPVERFGSQKVSSMLRVPGQFLGQGIPPKRASRELSCETQRK